MKTILSSILAGTLLATLAGAQSSRSAVLRRTPMKRLVTTDR